MRIVTHSWMSLFYDCMILWCNYEIIYTWCVPVIKYSKCKHPRRLNAVPLISSELFVLSSLFFVDARGIFLFSFFWGISGLGGRRKYRGWVVLSVAALRRQRRSSLRQNPRMRVFSKCGPRGLAISRWDSIWRINRQNADQSWIIREEANEIILPFQRASDNVWAVQIRWRRQKSLN